MEDLYGFPFLARLFYLKDSALTNIYQELALENCYKLKRWYESLRNHRDFKGIVPDLEI